MQFAIIGGDMRYAYLAKMLAAEGGEVTTVGLEKAELSPTVLQADSVAEAVKEGGIAVLPYPLMRSEGFLHAPLSRNIYSLPKIFGEIPAGTTVLLGGLEENTERMCRREGLSAVDYSKREEYLIQNAYITAEGAVKAMMEELPVTLRGQRILVAGYGRIGCQLCGLLQKMGARVTAAARRQDTAAWIQADGYDYCHTDRVEEILPRMDIVVNTIPVRIFHRGTWDKMKKCRLYVELASKPGGVDLTRLTQQGIPAICVRGIPGEYAPESAALVLKKTVEQILGEKGIYHA